LISQYNLIMVWVDQSVNEHNAELLERYKRMEEACEEFMKVWNEDGECGEIQMKTPIAWHRVLLKIEALNTNTNK